MSIDKLTLSMSNIVEKYNKRNLRMTSMEDGSTIELLSGRVEEVNDVIYLVDGNYTITDSGLADGPVYAHLKGDGNNATCYLSLEAGIQTVGGAYAIDGAKVIFSMIKDNGVYKKRHIRPDLLPRFIAIGNFIEFSKINNLGSFDKFTDVAQYDRTGTYSSTSYEKAIDINYDHTGTINIKGTISVGTFRTAYLRIYINDIETEFEESVSTGASGATLTVTGDITIAPDDNIQLYTKVSTSTTSNAKIYVRYRDIYSTYSKGEIII